MDYWYAIWNITRYIAYPVIYVLGLILHVLGIVVAPIKHLVHYLIYACWYPVHVLAKFESLYVFFGVAVLVGILTGTSLHYVSAAAVTVLDLDGPYEKREERTSLLHRAKNQRRLAQRGPLLDSKRQSESLFKDRVSKAEPIYWEESKRNRGRSGIRLVPNTILEEDSTEDGS